MIRIKRIYNPRETADGYRILVDRLWPRGVSKEKAKIDIWLKEIAPSDGLRKWFGHDPGRWEEFKNRYDKELDSHKPEIIHIRNKSRTGRVTLLYATKDERHNNAVALLSYLT